MYITRMFNKNEEMNREILRCTVTNRKVVVISGLLWVMDAWQKKQKCQCRRAHLCMLCNKEVRVGLSQEETRK